MKGFVKITALATQPPAPYGNEIDQTLCLGNPFCQEAVFFHKESRTAIFTDLIINRRVEGVPFFARCFLQADGGVAPNDGTPRFYKWKTLHRRHAQLFDAKIKSWQPEPLLFAHSEGFSEPAMTVLNREFAFLD